jgi:hypothetical protein
MLVLDVARRAGTPVAGRDLVWAGLRVTPIAVLGAALVLAAQGIVAR